MAALLSCSTDALEALHKSQYVISSIPPVAARLYDPVSTFPCSLGVFRYIMHQGNYLDQVQQLGAAVGRIKHLIPVFVPATACCARTIAAGSVLGVPCRCRAKLPP